MYLIFIRKTLYLFLILNIFLNWEKIYIKYTNGQKAHNKMLKGLLFAT